jgi:hypothetical protein
VASISQNFRSMARSRGTEEYGIADEYKSGQRMKEFII